MDRTEDRFQNMKERMSIVSESLILILVLVVLLGAPVLHLYGTTGCYGKDTDKTAITELPWGSRELPIRMGRYRQLFIDDYVIAEMQGVKQVLNQPKKYPGNPIIAPDRPWEGNRVLGPGVKFDEKKNVFTMDYQANWPNGVRTCRAVSKDGMNWVKPELGMVEFKGSKKNNLFRGERSSGPKGLHTPWDPDPQKQYKMFAGRHGPGMFSPDGYTWTTPPESKKVANVASDSSVMIVYDHVKGRYVGFTKTIAMGGGHDRRSYGITFSDDFLEWTPMKAILVPDARDEVLARQRVSALRDRVTYDDGPKWHLAQLYYMRQIPYQGMYIGLLMKFDLSGWPPELQKQKLQSTTAGGEDGIAYYELASSRDLEHWERAGNREIFLPVGEAGTWEAGIHGLPREPIIVGDEIRFYYASRRTLRGPSSMTSLTHPEHEAAVAEIKKEARLKGKKYSGAGIGLATLRLDGWVSVDAGPAGGALTTKCVVFEPGKKLVINAAAPKGSVAVEILYPTGKPVAGFTESDCDIFSSDAIRHTVTWHGQADLSELADKPVSLRFYLRDAKLFSFTVSENCPR